ncbi:MAG: N-acetylmuramoyl-L-alanine amidase [Clostridia bacterium]|nr:N-acetylmuramoyl-L-alanine amidase [Clostridia bacterium]
MLIFIKKWNACLLFGVFLLGVLSLGLALGPEKVTKTAATPGFSKLIVLDAGHGNPDGGAVGSQGVLEQELNLKIAQLVQQYAEQGGIQVLVTRADSEGIYDPNSKTIKQKKQSDIHNREKLMNESGADLFVSIHMNKFTEPQYSGPQVFYSKNDEASQMAARAVQQSMIDILKPVSEREIKQAGKEIYLLKKAKIPAILIECGFLSNPQEEKLLLDEAYQKQVAWAIYCGLVQYFALI